jgi:hypothetical protein
LATEGSSLFMRKIEPTIAPPRSATQPSSLAESNSATNWPKQIPRV